MWRCPIPWWKWYLFSDGMLLLDFLCHFSFRWWNLIMFAQILYFGLLKLDDSKIVRWATLPYFAQHQPSFLVETQDDFKFQTVSLLRWCIIDNSWWCEIPGTAILGTIGSSQWSTSTTQYDADEVWECWGLEPWHGVVEAYGVRSDILQVTGICE